MKKLILTIATLVGVTAGAFAQGTVAFQNFSVTPPVTGRVWTNSLPGAGQTGNTNGGALAPSGFKVELMFAALGSTNFQSARIFTSGTGGGQFFDGSTVTLAGVTAGTGNGDTNNVQLFLRGWTGGFADYASAFAAASAGTAAVGNSAIFLNPTGGAGTALPANLTGWLAANPLVLAPVPEPSTLALGGLGIATLLMFRRKK